MATFVGVLLIAAVQPGPAAATPSPAPSVAQPSPPLDPETAASLQARSSGRPVEVPSMLTETTRVVANPDGTFTADVHAGPTRFRNVSGAWETVNLELEKRPDGSVAPKAHPRGLVMAGATGEGDHDLARLSSGTVALALGWRGRLTEPVLDGERATYPEVRSGIDLVVEASRTGFRQFLIVKNRAAAAGLADLTFPWRTTGVTPTSAADGGIDLRDDAGRYVGHVPAAEMWDATIGPKSGENLRRAPVGMVVKASQRGRSTSTLALTPQVSFFDDPQTRYPITVDPSPTLKPGFDAFVQTGIDGDQSASKELKLGYVEERGTFTARSFIRWPTSFLQGKRVTAATMYLWNHWSWSCGGAKWQVWITGGAGPSTNWNRQPAWGGAGKPVAESTMSKGYSNDCGDGWVTANVRDTFQWAATNKASTLTTGLRATQADEDARNEKTWKKFSSSEDTKDPYVSITYNTRPVPPTDLTIGGRGCEPGDPRAFVSRLPYYPNVQAKAVDPDKTERTLTAQFFIAQKGAALPPSPTMTDTATHGSYATKTIPAGFALKENATYVMRAKTTDGLDVSDWSTTCEFTVDSAGPAKPPVVTSSSYPECLPTVCDTSGGVGVSGKFVFEANGVADVVKYRYWFDGDPKGEIAAAAPGGSATVRLSPPALDNPLHIDDLGIGGQRVLHVESVDPAGRSSAEYRSAAQPDEAVGYNLMVGTAPPAAARWPMNDPAGSTTLADASGNNQVLTLSGGVAKSADGAGDGGDSFTFDGTGTAYGVSPYGLAGNFTISAVARLSAKGSDRTVVRHMATGFASGLAADLYYDSGVDRWCAHKASLTSRAGEAFRDAVSVCSTTAPALGVWTHLTATFDATRNAMGVYVNGTKVGTASPASPPVPGVMPVLGRFAIGALTFKGEIDEVRAWDRLLHPEEIAAAAAAEAGRWDLDRTGADTSVAPTPHDVSDPAVSEEWWNDVGHLEHDPGSARFDGTRALTTTGPVIRTDQSFTVAAWVNLSDLPTASATAVGQDGVYRSGFYLGSRAFGNTGMKWSFSLTNGDSADVVQFMHAEAPSPIVDDDIGSWVHLVGVYDAAAQQIRLYVDGQLVKTTARSARWNANGPFTIGRAVYHRPGAEPARDYARASVDAVRVYAGVLSPAMVTRLYKTTDGRL